MAFPNIFKMLFENAGAGPKLRTDILPLATPTTPGLVPAGGTAGQYLKVNSAGTAVAWATDPAVAGQTWTITTSGTWTPPAVGRYYIRMVGGGGEGGYLYFLGSGGAGGGASGAYSEKIIDITALTPIPVTIGAGGDSGFTPVPAGATSFGAYLTAAGGNGGGTRNLGDGNASSWVTSDGGTPNGKAGSNPGNPGTVAYAGSTGLAAIRGGLGASSLFGAGGAGGSATASVLKSNGAAASGYGSGGGGCAISTGGNSATGGNGSPGLIIIERIS